MIRIQMQFLWLHVERVPSSPVSDGRAILRCCQFKNKWTFRPWMASFPLWTVEDTWVLNDCPWWEEMIPHRAMAQTSFPCRPVSQGLVRSTRMTSVYVWAVWQTGVKGTPGVQRPHQSPSQPPPPYQARDFENRHSALHIRASSPRLTPAPHRLVWKFKKQFESLMN